MKFPKLLKDFNFFLDGDTFVGRIKEVELPSFKYKTEDIDNGGLAFPIETQYGLEKLEMTWTPGEFAEEVFATLGACKHNATIMRFAGSLESDDSCDVHALEVEAAGRHREVELPKAKKGDVSETKIVTALSFLKITLNGKELVYLDAINCIERFNGKDRLEGRRRAIGL